MKSLGKQIPVLPKMNIAIVCRALYKLTRLWKIYHLSHIVPHLFVCRNLLLFLFLLPCEELSPTPCVLPQPNFPHNSNNNPNMLVTTSSIYKLTCPHHHFVKKKRKCAINPAICFLDLNAKIWQRRNIPN